MTIRTLIVDDELLGRRMMQTLLRPRSDVEIVGTCKSGRAAIQAIRKHTPDLVCLDVEMPEVDGFAVLDALAPTERPAVIFVTAYDHYAVQAFEAHALDYVTKPVDDERLAASIERVHARLQEQSAAALQDDLRRVLDTVTASDSSSDAPSGPTRILVDAGSEKRLLPAKAITHVSAAGDYVEVHTDEQSYLLSATMKAMEERLDPHQFVRIHRSTIVNLDWIDRMRPRRNGEYTLVLADGTELKLSRTYHDTLERRLEGDL